MRWVALVLSLVVPALASANADIVVALHVVTDNNGGTLLIGDAVQVSVIVENIGDADATATLFDSLKNLQQPTSISLDGVACVGCSSTATSVTAPMTVASGSSKTLAFSAIVPDALTGPSLSSTVTITFSPADTGASPTSPDVATADIDSIFRGRFE